MSPVHKQTRRAFLRSDPRRVYLGELTEIINRSERTVYDWMHKRKLPSNLMPKRGWHNYWYWTPAQANEIAEWCSHNGNMLLTTREQYDRHAVTSRKGYRMPRKVIRKIKRLEARNFSREQIVEELFAEVTYTTTDAFENAIVNVCLYNGFPVPPRFLTRHDLRLAQRLCDQGESLQAIVNVLYRRTGYTDHIELEGDLVRAFVLRDWELPYSDPNVSWKDKLTHRQQAEIRALERQLTAIERLLK